jgi:hypothetical protein
MTQMATERKIAPLATARLGNGHSDPNVGKRAPTAGSLLAAADGTFVVPREVRGLTLITVILNERKVSPLTPVHCVEALPVGGDRPEPGPIGAI